MLGYTKPKQILFIAVTAVTEGYICRYVEVYSSPNFNGVLPR